MNNEYVGTINDVNIISQSEKGLLIAEEFCKENVKQACYELRASKTYYELTDTQGKQKRDLNNGQYILIKPKQNIVVITLETIRLPSNVLGRILTKGSLFSVGLMPVNTYADPGFDGKLGIVFHNSSNNYLKIYPEESIAKIEFTKLSEEVARPYNGQHGYQTNLWPIPEGMVLSKDEIKNDVRIGSTFEEIESSYGSEVAKVTKLISASRFIVITSTIYAILMIVLVRILIGSSGFNEFTWTISLGVASAMVFQFLNFLYIKHSRKI